jgi:hypothetical protein
MGMNTAAGLTGLMSGRKTYLLSQTDFTNAKPVISNIVSSSDAPVIGTSISITANVTNTNTNAVFLGYRSALLLPFTKVLMYDDGAHNDGASGDNVYGITMPITTISTQYYIYAENNSIGAFSPVRAEHEFYTINATYPTIAPGTLVINELMAQNTSTVTDPNGDYSDWIELYNNSSITISLDNLYATDTSLNLLKWAFPLGITMAPNSYLTVWADQDLTQAGIHADFKFSGGGESCILSYPNGVVVDAVNFGLQTSDMGYARNPNGTGNFVIQTPTFNANNESLATNPFEMPKNTISIYPNPASNQINVTISDLIENENIKIFNQLGQLVLEQKASKENTINVATLASGTYILSYNQISKKIILLNK